MQAILFLGTSLVSAQYISKAVQTLGYRPIFLLKIDDYSGNPRAAIEQCEHYEVDVNSLEDIYRAIDANQFMGDVIGVTSFLDETLHHACSIAEKYKIMGPETILAKLIDKADVVKFIPEYSPPSLIFTLGELAQDQLSQFIADNKSFSEFLLKPTISSGAVVLD